MTPLLPLGGGNYGQFLFRTLLKTYDKTKQIALLENASAAFAFTSGMSALCQVTRLAAGGELVCSDDIYGDNGLIG